VESGTPPGSVKHLVVADARALLFARALCWSRAAQSLGRSQSGSARRDGSPPRDSRCAQRGDFSVDGDSSFGTFTGFLHAFAVPWAIVCDGSVYRFGTGKQQIFDKC